MRFSARGVAASGRVCQRGRKKLKNRTAPHRTAPHPTAEHGSVTDVSDVSRTSDPAGSCREVRVDVLREMPHQGRGSRP